MTFTFELDVNADDVDGNPDYSGYRIVSFTGHPETLKVLTINYKYDWVCGDGCCSDNEYGECHASHVPEWVREYILKQYPNVKFPTE